MTRYKLSKFKYEISEKFAEFSDFLMNIKEEFASGTDSIHKARNELKIIRCKDISMVVKSFKIPGFINSPIYSFIRESKAKRSFLNSARLYSLGVETPEPVGYIEFYECGLLRESFFVSLMYENDFVIRKAIEDKTLEDRENLLKSFADFTFDIHSKHVYHLDYSAGNILVKRQGGKYFFALTDINRMKFRALGEAEKLKSFQKLWPDEDTLELLMRRYAPSAGLDVEASVKKSLGYLRSFKRKINAKNDFKKFRAKLKN